MKTAAYPTREKDRWEHALTRPVSRSTKFELLELMRADLFELLDVLTTCPYDDDKSNEDRARDLQRVAYRLAELTPRRAKALRAALKAGRVKHVEGAPVAHCGPYSALLWEEVYQLWDKAR